MKNQIISVSCMITVVVFLILSFKTNDILMGELSKALAVIFLLLCMKYLQKAGLTEKENH